ncbi:unnamed protein product (macronuclear) [Paramecium tetraurelia]|uniref:Transmembrane protein n=1 Tax=Paramecium tetraurelia TaxID=5888 RepID=A0C956_PARTE|nr:uncharacterized protein GSPATT00006629001 [Paramecium tetraurelia]CAK67323.1 unnamed protein product [Paramecium tetraurelia]|eukprot:XP_001434720.1 hypothetical protein (macronuclear) [Paramecium tetraurelia strain d4-2]
MIFDITGLDIAIGQISLNFLVSLSYLIRSKYNQKISQKSQKIILKQNTKKQSEEVFQTKLTIQNQTSSIKKNVSALRSSKPNEIDQNNSKKNQVDNYPQSSGLLLSPSNKILENDKLMSDTNRQTHRSSLVPILQTQKQQITSKSSSCSQNLIQPAVKPSSDQNKSIINQLKKENPSFAGSKLVQCQQCKADNSVEQSDDIITIERKRNMSLPSELKEDENQEKIMEKKQQEEQRLKIQQYKDTEYSQYIQLQNHFLLFSCIFFVQSIIHKINSNLSLYEEINLNNILEIYLLQACIGGFYYNVFQALIIIFLEKVLKCHSLITRLLFSAYNISAPFYLYSTMQEQSKLINLEFLLMIGCIYFLQFLVFIFCRILNWKNYPLTLFLTF